MNTVHPLLQRRWNRAQSRPQYRPDAREPALRRQDPRERIVPRAGGPWQTTLPHARRRAGIRRAEEKPERAPARAFTGEAIEGCK